MTVGPDPLAGKKKQRRPPGRSVREYSAGGIVVDNFADHGPVHAALIGRLRRNGHLQWSLPKGHIEPGECPEQAAVREIAEETGITGIVVASLGNTKYWFRAGDRRVHKTVHHFLLQYCSGVLSADDHEVAEVAWVPLDDLPQQLAHKDERRLAAAASDLLREVRVNGPAALPPLPASQPRRNRQTHLRAGPSTMCDETR